MLNSSELCLVIWWTIATYSNNRLSSLKKSKNCTCLDFMVYVKKTMVLIFSKTYNAININVLMPLSLNISYVSCWFKRCKIFTCSFNKTLCNMHLLLKHTLSKLDAILKHGNKVFKISQSWLSSYQHFPLIRYFCRTRKGGRGALRHVMESDAQRNLWTAVEVCIAKSITKWLPFQKQIHLDL